MDFTPFVDYCKKHIKGDEKGEAQIFLDHFFSALGYPDGLKGAGADCEFRIKNVENNSTSFADLVWKPRVLIEMKKKGEDLSIHYQQIFSYWLRLVPHRPKYIILCNFDFFWIYDFDENIYEPLEKIEIASLNERKEAFSFLYPVERKPIFNYNQEDVTEKVAVHISALYKSLTLNKNRNPRIAPHDSIVFCLQCILCLFAEDTELLPNQIFSRIIKECAEIPGSGYDKITESFDLISGLFLQMNSPGKTEGGRYKDVDYFNGGLFEKILPIELEKQEIDLLEIACRKNWHHINPAIFGSIFENAMDESSRHILGAHYTHEADIKKIVDPVIVQPWNEMIEEAAGDLTKKTTNQKFSDLISLHKKLTNFKVLDPACGSGNFLFIAYKETKLIENKILKFLTDLSIITAKQKELEEYIKQNGLVATKQFFGIDLNSFAVEIAKVTLMIAKELSIREKHDNQETLPLDNLDFNIVCGDALFSEWPEVDAIIGNPPFQSKNNMKQEFGIEYVNRLRAAYPEVPGRADFCVYWFYKAHKHLKNEALAGLVGTNTIRQNFSRKGSLDYITLNVGEIINAYSSIHWSGDAAVYVSIVSWKKGQYKGDKELYVVDKKGELQRNVLSKINSSLSLNTDVSSAKTLNCNKNPKRVFQGQTHGHEGFLLSKSAGLKLIKFNPEYREILRPFLIGEDLVGNIGAQPSRFVVDFTLKDLLEASTYKEVYKIISELVLPDRESAAKDQLDENNKALEKDAKAKVNKHHINFLKFWWKLGYGREEMLLQKSHLKKYIVCARVTQRPIFEFIDSEINPNDKLIAFMFDDDYSFGIIQSILHWKWFTENCTTLAETPNYNSASIWDTFPWPQNPSEAQVNKVASCARELYTERSSLLSKYNLSLRDLYRITEQPGQNTLKDIQTDLDKSVIEAFGFTEKEDLLNQLLELNSNISLKENQNVFVERPGLPSFILDKSIYVSEHCVKFEWT